MTADQVEHREPGFVADDRLAIDQADRTGNAATAIATKGKRRARSLPLRVISRTPPVSRRAMIRKPSATPASSDGANASRSRRKTRGSLLDADLGSQSNAD